jgi:hypothetical protein
LAPVQPTPPRRTGLIVGLALVALVVLGGAAVGVGLAVTHGRSPGQAPAASAATAAFNAHGTLTLTDALGVENLDDVNCTGMGGYSDITLGAQVVITDQSGTTIAVTDLGGGQMIGSGMSRQCAFDFSAGSVPAGKSFYGVTIGHRGTIQYSQAELESGVELSLGD